MRQYRRHIASTGGDETSADANAARANICERFRVELADAPLGLA